MLMVLENDTMNLIDPLGQTLLHAQPIGSIRVWGVGRDNGRSVSPNKHPLSRQESEILLFIYCHLSWVFLSLLNRLSIIYYN